VCVDFDEFKFFIEIGFGFCWKLGRRESGCCKDGLFTSMWIVDVALQSKCFLAFYSIYWFLGEIFVKPYGVHVGP
jgi:hypothetical protein